MVNLLILISGLLIVGVSARVFSKQDELILTLKCQLSHIKQLMEKIQTENIELRSFVKEWSAEETKVWFHMCEKDGDSIYDENCKFCNISRRAHKFLDDHHNKFIEYFK